MKKLICSSLALVCILSSMVGCGDAKEKDAKEETTTVAETTAEATTEAAETTTESGKAESIDSKDAVGKWQCSKLILDGQEMDSLYGVDAYALFQIELKDDNKGTFYSFIFNEENKPEDIEWENKDGKIQLISKEVFDEDEVFLENEGGKMILNLSDEGDTEQNEAVLEKVDDFKEIPEDMEMKIDLETEAEADFDLEEAATATSAAEEKE
ncbi:hypothetical protein SAMN02910265_01605 [Ruminococcus flavefaciens]|uniref:Lipocalin-like domain-containing protein n=1 Tax=Ruminococcus flavefaciens TaxID=1265 RepID=A0A1H6JCB6_RUMFL|nr:hypothetical protein [Ruminococcus flavefaciens]SEH58019.1 hypothetical protein SAMN02910265_01605 [Ruminococcus flavefaciens]